jgi:hypothetical protein
MNPYEPPEHRNGNNRIKFIRLKQWLRLFLYPLLGFAMGMALCVFVPRLLPFAPGVGTIGFVLGLVGAARTNH